MSSPIATSASAGRAVCWAAAALALLCAAGCGQKGPLYLPDPAPQSVPAGDSGAVPGASGEPAGDRPASKRKPTPSPDPGR
jgi:predicted small lipoprotein YifL